MFKSVIPAMFLATAAFMNPAFAAAPSQSGTINFYGYVYDDTAIQAKAELVDTYIPALLSGQMQKADLEWAKASQNNRLVISKKQLDSHRMMVNVSYR